MQKRLIGLAARTWFERLADKLGTVEESKHQRGRTRPPGHRRALRKRHKAQRVARRAQRGR